MYRTGNMPDDKIKGTPIDKICLFTVLDAILLKAKMSIVELAPQLAVKFNIDVETARDLLTEWAHKPYIQK